MRKISGLFLSAALCLSASPVLANPIVVDGVTVSNEGMLRNGRVLIPVRAAESIGWSVGWNNGTQTVILRQDRHTVELVPGMNKAKVDGNWQELDSAPLKFQNRVYVPLRFLAGVTKSRVTWDEQEKTVYLNTMEEQEYETRKALYERYRNELEAAKEEFNEYTCSNGETGSMAAVERLKEEGDAFMQSLEYFDLPEDMVVTVRLYNQALTKLVESSERDGWFTELESEYEIDETAAEYEMGDDDGLDRQAFEEFCETVKEFNSIVTEYNIKPVELIFG